MEKEDVEDAEDEEKGKLGGKEREEPLAGVHLGGQANLLQKNHKDCIRSTVPLNNNHQLNS